MWRDPAFCRYLDDGTSKILWWVFLCWMLIRSHWQFLLLHCCFWSCCHSSVFLLQPPKPQDLAVVCFTSGTTGTMCFYRSLCESSSTPTTLHVNHILKHLPTLLRMCPWGPTDNLSLSYEINSGVTQSRAVMPSSKLNCVLFIWPGKPKGAMITHGNIASNSSSVIKILEVCSGSLCLKFRSFMASSIFSLFISLHLSFHLSQSVPVINGMFNRNSWPIIKDTLHI